MAIDIADPRAALLPKGHLRAAVNLANIALVQADPIAGTLKGVSVELAREFARFLDCPVEFVPYPSASRILDCVDKDEWDVAFLAFDPAREDRLVFSPAYALIEATLVVRDDSPYRSFQDLDIDGVEICVTRNAAYDLYLSRRLANARIVHASTPADALEMFAEGPHHAVAGVRQALERFAGEHDRFRLLAEPFLVVRQTVAIRRSANAGASLIREFIEGLVLQGFSEAIVDHAKEAGVTLTA